MALKVLHCIYDDARNPWVAGGGAVRAFEIYRRLVGQVDATVVTGSYPGARDEVVDGVRYRRLGARGPYAWSRATYGRAATRLLRHAEYDAALFDFSAYTPLFLPRGRPTGLVVHHVTGPTAGARWGRLVGGGVALLERRMLGRSREISVSARWAIDQLRPLVRADASFHVVGAGVPDELFELERVEADWLLYFGRLDIFQKGLDTLLEAFARLRATRPTLRLRIAGRGKDGEAVRALARRLGVTDGLEMLGAVSDDERVSLLARARVMLMPSRFEGFGLVAAEAMAAGAPLVAAAGGSLPEVVSPPEGGVIVPVDDAGALAAAVAALLDDAGGRAALSRTARETARRYEWNAVADRHHRFIERVAGQQER